MRSALRHIHAGFWCALLGIALTACAASATSRAPRHDTIHNKEIDRANAIARGVLARDIAELRRSSYTVDYHTAAKLPGGGVLVIFHSICTGSADGHCQAIDVFENDASRPIWHRSYIGVLAIRPVDKGFSVKAANYAPNDPLCCPSLPPVTDVFVWTGHGFRERGPRPGLPH